MLIASLQMEAADAALQHNLALLRDEGDAGLDLLKDAARYAELRLDHHMVVFCVVYKA